MDQTKNEEVALPANELPGEKAHVEPALDRAGVCAEETLCTACNPSHYNGEDACKPISRWLDLAGFADDRMKASLSLQGFASESGFARHVGVRPTHESDSDYPQNPNGVPS